MFRQKIIIIVELTEQFCAKILKKKTLNKLFAFTCQMRKKQTLLKRHKSLPSDGICIKISTQSLRHGNEWLEY